MTNFFEKLVFLSFLLICLAGPVQAADVTLTWSADTYVPPAYPGRALPSRGSSVEVIAHLESGSNPNSLIYKWTLDNRTALIGLGEEVLQFRMSERSAEGHKVRLEVYALDNITLVASSNLLTIRPAEPEIAIETDSIIVTPNQAVEFTAHPYFFNITHPDELNYNWSFEGLSPERSGHEQDTFILRIGSVTESIQQVLEVWVAHPRQALQRASTKLALWLTP